MSYELRGEKPNNREGEAFRMASLTWPMLAQVVQNFAPDECRPCREWYGAESHGHGLDEAQSLRLAAALDAGIPSTELRDFIAENYQTGECWLSIRDVQEFVAFLRACGGFSIT